MLSRRRSSERASVALSTAAQTPAQRRLDAALRGASILFSVQAQLDPSATLPSPASTTASAALPRSPLPRLPDLSGDLANSDISAMRRLFSRESRLRRPRTPAPGDPRRINHLAVASHGKSGDVIRLHQLVDHGPGARAAVHRTWPLADLRKIDGLGRPVKESLQFALFFASSTKMTAWRCNSPQERATFLWSLLQSCVSQLKRAPPVSNLLLLDLQTMAESSPDSEKGDPDDSSSGAFQGGPRPIRATGSLDQLSPEREQHSGDLKRTTGEPSDSCINPAVSPNGSTTASTLVANNSASGQEHSQGQRLFEEVEETPLDGEGERIRGESPESLIRARGRMMREMSKNQRVKRTLSEPKASKLHVESTEDSDVGSDDGVPKKADTIAPGQKTVDPKLKELNIDERAFLAAARRMGANRSFEVKRVDADRDSSQGSDPKARFFQHRLKMGEANTAKVVAERKIQEEKKLFKLSAEEQQDLAFALKRFRTEQGERPLNDFGSWAEARIQVLEVENIADIVNVEKTAMPHWLGNRRTVDAQGKKGTLEELEEGKWPYDTLVESMTFAEPWLDKCQTLLAPYAALAEDINKGVILLEVQRKNASDLNKLLMDLIETLSFEPSEQSLVDGIGTADASLNLSEFDGEDFQAAAQVIASKVAALQRLSSLSDMAAVTKVQNLLSQRQGEASTILVPMLTGYIDQLYEREHACIAGRFFEKLRRSRLREILSTEREEFLTGVKSLAIFGRSEFVNLVEHFTSLSSVRVADLLRFVMGKVNLGHADVAQLVAGMEMLIEGLFYAGLLEGSLAYQLFAKATETQAYDEDFCLSKLLRRQISNSAIINDFVIEGSGGDKTLQTCLHLHASYYLNYFSEIVAKSHDQGIDSLIMAVESRLAGDNVDSVLARTRSEERKSDTSVPFVVNQSDAPVWRRSWPDPVISGRAPSLPPVDFKPDRNVGCFGDRECTTAGISNFLGVCREISNGCSTFAEEQVNISIAFLSSPVDTSSGCGRAEFFSFVKRAVDLCDELTSPKYELFNGPITAHHMMEATKSHCERLIAAAMRSTEISTHSCTERVSDVVKLQCYGYIAAKLGKSKKPEFVIPLAHLSTRVWKHVMLKWAERELFGILFGGLRVDTVNRPAEANAKFQSAVSELDVVQTVAQVKESLLTALGTAANGVLLLPSCNNFISLTKERLEDTLRLAKKQKLSADARSRLLLFSKELLSSLRTELGGMHPMSAR